MTTLTRCIQKLSNYRYRCFCRCCRARLFHKRYGTDLSQVLRMVNGTDSRDFLLPRFFHQTASSVLIRDRYPGTNSNFSGYSNSKSSPRLPVRYRVPYRMRHRLAIIKKSQIPISAKIRGKSSSLWGTGTPLLGSGEAV